MRESAFENGVFEMASQLQGIIGSPPIPTIPKTEADAIRTPTCYIPGSIDAAPSAELFNSRQEEAFVQTPARTWNPPRKAVSEAPQRAVDVLLSILFLLLLSPVMIAAAVLVTVSGAGPLIFRHNRIGMNERTFVCLKFRTMEVQAEELLPHLLTACDSVRHEWERDHKIRQDPRVTPIGRFLRRFSIDELPQLVNVIRGEMSIVGPRPIVESEVRRYGAHFRDYCSVRPGLTGLWQVSGRNDLSYARRVQLDCEYARSKSISGDLLIILRTLPVVLLGRGY